MISHSMFRWSMSKFDEDALPTRALPRIATSLAWSSVAAPLLFVLAWSLLGLARPGYSPISQPISGLGVGPGATLMNAAFVLEGVLQIAGTVGALLLMPDVRTSARWSGGILLGLSGLGAVLCGLYTWRSFAPHMIGSALGLAGPALGFFVTGLALRRTDRWTRLGGDMLMAAALTLALGIAFYASFDLNAVMTGRGVAGLIERVLATEIQIAYAALALAAVRGDRRKAYKGVAMEGFIASWYARITQSETRNQEEQARAIAARAPAGGRVLEIAPGPGYLAIALAKLGRQEVFGVDISRTFVEIATRNARAAGVTVRFQRGNASELPYPDASFDFVICRAAFKNFSDPMGALNEIHRVLKPGGAASILDLRRESSPEEIRALVDAMRLSPLSSFWTMLTFRFFLLKNAYSRAGIEDLAARSRFGSGEVSHNGVEFDLRLSKAQA